MTRADRIFIENCKAILNSPFSDEGMQVRPVWKDGTPAHTKKVFGLCNVYDLREEFPIMTLRRIYWKTAFQEILWIYQKKSNIISQLGSHIWDSWDVGDGTIGKAYGYQIAQMTSYPEGTFDQMDKALYDLKHNPTSRSIITTTYNMKDLPEMGLRPCAYSMTYNVTKDQNTGEMVLNGLLNQRSQDMLTANNWNTVQYALLLMMVANEVGMTPGILVHMIADAHIYDRHIPIVEDIITRGESGNPYMAPTVIMDKVPFYLMGTENVHMEGYMYDDTNYTIEVAI